jgi:hypothetical protein
MNANVSYVLCKRLTLADAPGSGGTVTIFDTTTMSPKSQDHGLEYKMILFAITSSAASAANGITIDESWDKGQTWDNLMQQAALANTYTKVFAKVSAPDVRVRYANSAAVLTTFRGGMIADSRERGNG